MIEGIVPAEIRAEGEAIRATLAGSLRAAQAAAEALRAAGVRRIHVIGNGTSYHSSMAAATLYRRLAAAGDPTVIALDAGEFRNYLPGLDRCDAVIGISASGEFRDVLVVVDELRDRIPTVGIVHVPGSTLDRTAAHAVRSYGGTSGVPIMTKTFVATLAATHLVLGELLGGARAQGVRAALAAAADDVEAAVAVAAPRVGALADELATVEHIFVVGSGNATAAAFEAALKLKETALVHAEGAESWEMATGAGTIVGPGSVVIALAPAGPGREATLDLARHAARWGARIVEVGPGEEPEIEGADHLPLPATAAEDYAPLVAVAPVALFAFVLARRRGLDPDRPEWVDRYHSQGLRHIVGVDSTAEG
ncbi:MAG: SIS domain-containing protein [Candidatus Limnocylindrales bacterium]|jgi:glucosamine--fructose-6-phosphate aminotransferase (isomerizing)